MPSIVTYNLMTPNSWERLEVHNLRDALYEAWDRSKYLKSPVTVVTRDDARRTQNIVGSVYPDGSYIDAYNRKSRVENEY